MRRFLSVTVAVAVILFGTGAAFAYMGGGWGPGWHMGAGGPGMMGPGWRMGAGGPGMMGPGWRGGEGTGPCPMWGGAGPGGPAGPASMSEDDAKGLVEEYVKANLPGFTVEKVVPFQGRRRMAYQAELKGPKGETRFLHVNPWGQVLPFGPPPKG